MVWVFGVLRTKTSHPEEQQEEEELYPLLDHAVARLVKPVTLVPFCLLSLILQSLNDLVTDFQQHIPTRVLNNRLLLTILWAEIKSEVRTQ